MSTLTVFTFIGPASVHACVNLMKPEKSNRPVGPYSPRQKGNPVAADKNEKQGQKQEQQGGETVTAKEQGERVEVVKAEGDGIVAERLEMKSKVLAPGEGWTVQQGGHPPEAVSFPGQVFVASQLPDPEVQKAAGIDPVQQNAGLIVLDDDKNLQHPSGLEPSDVVLATHLVEGEVRKPDRLNEANGELRVPNGLE